MSNFKEKSPRLPLTIMWSLNCCGSLCSFTRKQINLFFSLLLNYCTKNIQRWTEKHWFNHILVFVDSNTPHRLPTPSWSAPGTPCSSRTQGHRRGRFGLAQEPPRIRAAQAHNRHDGQTKKSCAIDEISLTVKLNQLTEPTADLNNVRSIKSLLTH